MSEPTMADKIAMYVGGGLILLGAVVIGVLETFLGATHPVTGKGQIVHETLLPVDVRAYIILAGLLVWMVYAIYKLVGTSPASDRAPTRDAKTAD